MHLAERWLQEPQRDRSVVTVLLDEVHDILAVIRASGSHSPADATDRMRSMTSSWVASSWKMSHRESTALKASFRRGITLRTEDRVGSRR